MKVEISTNLFLNVEISTNLFLKVEIIQDERTDLCRKYGSGWEINCSHFLWIFNGSLMSLIFGGFFSGFLMIFYVVLTQAVVLFGMKSLQSRTPLDKFLFNIIHYYKANHFEHVSGFTT